jgi:hypothetical protein
LPVLLILVNPKMKCYAFQNYFEPANNKFKLLLGNSKRILSGKVYPINP